MTHGRGTAGVGLRLAVALGIVGGAISTAQAQGLLRRNTAATTKATEPAAKPAAATEEPAITLKPVAHLVSPNEPIALVNNEPITRQQLADECVAQKGSEILEMLIARKLIAQAMRANKIEVTPAEVNEEIDRVALNVANVTRERWLATLSKERKISPERYARDVIYPALRLRKLARPRVKVTEQDMKDAYEAQFGERIKCRMILLNDARIATQVWEDVKKNPPLFEKIAQEKSIDPSTRAAGGMLPEALARHANPRDVSDKIFAQLVDVDPSVDRKSPDFEKFKPKDGDISGIVQVTDATWAIFKREGVIPARSYDEKNPEIRRQVQESLFEAKLQYEVNDLLSGLMRDAAIENRLTGQIKPSKAEEMQAPADAQIQRSATPAAPAAANPSKPAASGTPTPPSPLPAGTIPAGISADDAQRVQSLRSSK